MTKKIMVDLDGVLNNYNGEYKENEIPSAREGAREFLQNLAKDFEIEIFTVRNKKLTVKWLQDNNLDEFISDVTNVKNPFASIYLDDRGLNFYGNFENSLTEIRNFKPYWK